MTRINVVSPSELHYKHLLAEYRELPRIFTLVALAQAKGKTPKEFNIPKTYRLGTGHVLFFYDKLLWLKERHRLLCLEMHRRGYKVNFSSDSLGMGIKPEWWGDWKPTVHAKYINRMRINARLKTMKI